MVFFYSPESSTGSSGACDKHYGDGVHAAAVVSEKTTDKYPVGVPIRPVGRCEILNAPSEQTPVIISTRVIYYYYYYCRIYVLRRAIVIRSSVGDGTLGGVLFTRATLYYDVILCAFGPGSSGGRDYECRRGGKRGRADEEKEEDATTSEAAARHSNGSQSKTGGGGGDGGGHGRIRGPPRTMIKGQWIKRSSGGGGGGSWSRYRRGGGGTDVAAVRLFACLRACARCAYVGELHTPSHVFTPVVERRRPVAPFP